MFNVENIKFINTEFLRIIVVFLIMTVTVGIGFPRGVYASSLEDQQALILNNIKTMTFKHNGMTNSMDELKFIKQKIQASEEPWKSNFDKMKTSNYASLNYTPHPVADVYQGLNGSGDVGGFDEIHDAIAAYTQALMWIFTDDERYAQKSIEIMNAWSYTLKSHSGVNWYLQTSWVGSVFPVAAELIRDSYTGWNSKDIDQFKNMLNTKYLPLLNKRYAFGNREFSVISALMSIGVFNDDRAAFYQGVYHWMSYIKSYVYMSEDGSSPVVTDYWVNEPSSDEYYQMHSDIFTNKSDSWVYVNNHPDNCPADDENFLKNSTVDQLWKLSVTNYNEGFCAETYGRDLSHVENSISSVFIAAEIAWNQGIDLYSLESDRLAAFLEKNAYFRLVGPAPVINGVSIDLGNGLQATYETGYNHLHNIMEMDLPYTWQLITNVIRLQQNHSVSPVPQSIFATKMWEQAAYLADWETLTHGELNNNNTLVSSISSAENIYNTAVEGTDKGTYPEGTKDILKSAITNAEAVRDNKAASVLQMVEAATTLNSAVNVFQNLVITNSTGDFDGIPGYDIGDLGIIIGNYGIKAGDIGWNEAKKYDINGDSQIGFYEFNFLLKKILP